MAWNQVTPMEQMHRFVSLAATGRSTFTELGAEFGVSRKTGYKWQGRDQAEGARGLPSRSRCPRARELSQNRGEENWACLEKWTPIQAALMLFSVFCFSHATGETLPSEL